MNSYCENGEMEISNGMKEGETHSVISLNLDFLERGWWSRVSHGMETEWVRWERRWCRHSWGNAANILEARAETIFYKGNTQRRCLLAQRCRLHRFSLSNEKVKKIDKNMVSHSVTRVKIVKIKKFTKEIENQNSTSPPPPKINPLNV